MNKEVMVSAKKVVEDYPIPCDFDGKNILLMNNFVDAKNNYCQKLSVLNLETRESVHIREKVEKMRLGVFAPNGFAMVQEQSEVIYFNFLGRNLSIIKGRDDKGFFEPDRAVRLMMDDVPDYDSKENQGTCLA